MRVVDNIKIQIALLKKLIRYYQLLIAIRKNEPTPKKEEIINYIKKVAVIFKVDPEIALRVAQCESNFDPFAINFNQQGSCDRGLYQWNDKYHPHITDEMAFNYKIATELFCRAVVNGNLRWWNASKHCWKK